MWRGSSWLYYEVREELRLLKQTKRIRVLETDGSER